jgi:hypothetical protein
MVCYPQARNPIGSIGILLLFFVNYSKMGLEQAKGAIMNKIPPKGTSEYSVYLEQEKQALAGLMSAMVAYSKTEHCRNLSDEENGPEDYEPVFD